MRKELSYAYSMLEEPLRCYVHILALSLIQDGMRALELRLNHTHACAHALSHDKTVFRNFAYARHPIKTCCRFSFAIADGPCLAHENAGSAPLCRLLLLLLRRR